MTHQEVQCDLQEGPQDCGSFMLEVLGPYRYEQVRVRWIRSERPINPQVEQFIDRAWQRRMAQARAQGVPLWDGPLCRLLEYHASRDGLDMVLGPTSFREFLGTNLHNAHLRYSHGIDLLANPIGVSALVIAEGKYLVLGRRSQKVIYHAGRIHPIGGCVEPAQDGLPDPFRCICREVCEELGLGSGSLGAPLFLGMVRDKHIHQPEVIFDLQVMASVESIRHLMASAKEKEEHTDLVVLRDHPAAVVDFIERRLTELTPVGMATLLLHGLYRWGSGWFASTRGYLRGII